ncbi:MAG: hypothetical protein JO359_13070 [Candidatus Eremiobacteraeota bacterium]|nr:hypothetical protein [Candidatus Eremiobacteraeota bacterium]
MSNVAATAFTFLFALACMATFALGIRKEWKNARRTAMVVAILSFLMALLSASMIRR